MRSRRLARHARPAEEARVRGRWRDHDAAAGQPGDPRHAGAGADTRADTVVQRRRHARARWATASRSACKACCPRRSRSGRSRCSARVGRPLAEGMSVLWGLDLSGGTPRQVLAISLFTNDDPTHTAALEAAVAGP